MRNFSFDCLSKSNLLCDWKCVTIWGRRIKIMKYSNFKKTSKNLTDDEFKKKIYIISLMTTINQTIDYVLGE